MVGRMSRDGKRVGGDEAHYSRPVIRGSQKEEGSYMIKQELIDVIAASTGEAIDAILQVVTAAVTRGEAVQLMGFGSFSTGARAERAGRNPATGETITIPAAKTVKFTARRSSTQSTRSRVSAKSELRFRRRANSRRQSSGDDVCPDRRSPMRFVRGSADRVISD